MSPSSASSDEVSSLRQQLVVLSTPLKKIEAQCSENPSCSTHVVSSNQTLTSPSGLPAPVTFDQPSSSPTLFDLHVVIIPAAHQNQNLSYKIAIIILWMSITSVGERLALQLDSCCSVSLVSKVHAIS